jgi:hypothetical protein
MTCNPILIEGSPTSLNFGQSVCDRLTNTSYSCNNNNSIAAPEPCGQGKVCKILNGNASCALANPDTVIVPITNNSSNPGAEAVPTPDANNYTTTDTYKSLR